MMFDTKIRRPIEISGDTTLSAAVNQPDKMTKVAVRGDITRAAITNHAGMGINK